MPVLGDFLTLVSLPINIGDDTPVPSSGPGSLAYSSEISEVVWWDGNYWQHPPGSDYIMLKTSGSPPNLTIGQLVYLDQATNTVNKAVANGTDDETAQALGFILDQSVAIGDTARVLTDGIFTATTAEWDAVTGQSGGLTPGAYYYMSDVIPGMIITTVPTTTGHWIAKVGQAYSSTQLQVKINIPIKL